MQVIKKTNESASRLFPVALDVNNPNFFKYLDICACQKCDSFFSVKLSA